MAKNDVLTKERVILANGAGGSELLKSLAKHGRSCFNLRILSSIDLARYILTKSGIPVKEDFIDATEERVYIVKALMGETYFGKVTYNDVIRISEAIRLMRSLAADESQIESILEKGIFKEKNKALYSVYNKYTQLLKENHVLDRTSCIRYALENCKEVDAQFILLEEYGITPLEKALIMKASGGKAETISIRELFEKEEKTVHIESIRKCYGAANEVEMILTDIYGPGKKEDAENDGKKALDSCTVVVADSVTYGQLFFDYALLYDIPITFGCGIPMVNANPAKLLVNYYYWMTGGFYGEEALNRMLESGVFNRRLFYNELCGEDAENKNIRKNVFFEMLGKIRFTTDREQNLRRVNLLKESVERRLENLPERSEEYKEMLEKKECIPLLEKAACEFALPVEEFITKYAFVRTFGGSKNADLLQALDRSALEVIYNELKAIQSSGIEQSTDDIIKSVLSHAVCIQSMTEGALHVTTAPKAFSSLRKNLYIAGLSALKFPGSPKENYLLLDKDLENFGGDYMRYTSEGKILDKKKHMLRLVLLASALDTNIYLSYAGLNVAELKRENASSFIYEIFREEYGENATNEELEKKVEVLEYFEPRITATREIGIAYNEGKTVVNSYVPPAVSEVSVKAESDYSPTALNEYFDCPRRFMLKNVLRIPESKRTDPFEIMPATDCGILAHSLMEELANSDMSEEAFLEISTVEFDDYIKTHPPLVGVDAETEKNEFLNMMRTAYRMDPHREVVFAEEKITCLHESGIRIMGRPDRVEMKEDGTGLIVDYKTGRNLEHVENDAESCLQGLVYAYLMEHKQDNPIHISGIEFRYIRTGDVISCRYDDDKKRELSDILSRFKSGMLTGTFHCADPTADDSPCEFCDYAGICGIL